MSLAQVVHLVIVDVDQLIRLYRQLCQVPVDIQRLFLSITQTYTQLLDAESILAAQNVSVLFDDYVVHFKRFRSDLLDLELLLDPQQMLPRSGSNSEECGVVPWAGAGIEEAARFCQSFEIILKELGLSCDKLVSSLSQ